MEFVYAPKIYAGASFAAWFTPVLSFKSFEVFCKLPLLLVGRFCLFARL